MADVVASPPKPPAFEARLPCPVCLGVQMDKARIGAGTAAMVLDTCSRCGGVWFERGETQQLARFSPSDLWKVIPPRQTLAAPPCHGCHAPLDRNADRCLACGTKNELHCPVCSRMMQRMHTNGLTLDVCTSCHGVWFDHAELRSVWSIVIAEMQRPQQPSRGEEALAVGGEVLLHSLFWAPGLTLNAGAAVAHGIGAAASGLGNLSLSGAGSAATGAAEAVGGFAEGVFEKVLEIIGSIFDG